MSDPRPAVEAALASYTEPHLGTDLVSAGCLREVSVVDARVRVAIRLGFPADGMMDALRAELLGRLGEHPDLSAADLDLELDWQVTAQGVQGGVPPIDGVRNVIAVASGKGGVGKSTTAVNLALALAADGAAVGILDADIYGPSQPRMLGLKDARPTARADKRIDPLHAHGVVCMSAGFLVDEDTPMVWRGPMVTQALVQMLGDTDWMTDDRPLDYLIVDMPPGTGDIQLTLAQRVPVSGAVIVTTPQDIALIDARRGLRMFEKVDVRVLGIVENMSTHLCSNCGHEEAIFGAEGGLRLAEDSGVPLLMALPLELAVREQTDSGQPTVVAAPDSTAGQKYIEMARRTAALLSSGGGPAAFPEIVIEED
jgi:ATP-binding protein involved in chromosome partitioning